MDAFRIHFGDRAATRQELDRVERVTVEQEMDMAWEGLLRLSLCLGDDGRWRPSAGDVSTPFSRVRIEICRGTGSYVPLIDGPVAGYETALDPEPGRTTVTLKIRDDSVFLNREERTEVFENQTDSALARRVFGDFDEIADVRVETTTRAHPQTVRRGTAITFLRELAKANGFHAYVLPTDRRGHSRGCFLPPPTGTGDHPPLVLNGADQNLASLRIDEDADAPELTRGANIQLSDGQVLRAERRVTETELLRAFPALPDNLAAIRRVRPQDTRADDPADAVAAQNRRRSYAYKVSGTVAQGCYPAVLAPYTRISIRAGDLPISGAYLLTKVVHTITADTYAQAFEAKGDSRATPQSPSPGAPAGLPVNPTAAFSVF